MDKTVAAPNKMFLTSGEVATLLGCTSYWVNILIHQGNLESHRINERGWHRIPVASLEEYASAHRFKLNWSLLQKQ